MDSSPLPPGRYSNIQEAQRAAGFSFPHLQEPSNEWRLEEAEVKGPDLIEASTPEEAEALMLSRFVHLSYADSRNLKKFKLTIYEDPAASLQPADGGGEAEDVEVNGTRAILQLYEVGGGLAAFGSLHWQVGEVQIHMHAYLAGQRGKSGDSRMNRQEFLSLAQFVR